MEIKKFVAPVLNQNTYLIIEGKTAIVVDPGFQKKEVLSYLKRQKIELVGSILTHFHYDHSEGVDRICRKTKVKSRIYKADLDNLVGKEKVKLGTHIKIKTIGFRVFGSWAKVYAKEKNVQEFHSEKLIFDDFEHEVDVILLPGHTAGSVGYLINNCLFTGDTLVCDDDMIKKLIIINAHLPEEAGRKLITSMGILKKRFVKSDIVVYPGHGKTGNVADAIKKYDQLIKVSLK